MVRVAESCVGGSTPGEADGVGALEQAASINNDDALRTQMTFTTIAFFYTLDAA